MNTASPLLGARTARPSFRGRTRALARMRSGDPWLLGAVAVLLALGTVMVLSSSYFFARAAVADPFYYTRRHLAYVTIGLMVAAFASRLHWTFWEQWARVLFALGLTSLLLVLVWGYEEGGARRWLKLGPLPVTVQPVEFVKTILVVYLARYLARRQDRIHLWWEGILPPVCVVGVVLALLYKQPDFGTMVILGATTGAMLLLAGVTRYQIGVLGLVGVALAAVGIWVKPYRFARLLVLWSAWEHERGLGYQVVQSMIAIGSGGISGVGLGASQQKLFFLPAAHTDFIFALIGEELGLVGMALVLGMFSVIALRGLQVARAHEEPFVRFLAAGLTLTLILEAWLNIAVALGMAPPKGLALPFVSYGGSALVGALLRVGILWNLSRQTST
ncbi:MAG: stage V sporulation protein E [Candidatus Binatia bacterium]|nr:MAG: stage V sporulation protein E [Candidatus Binatia bacterium]